VNIREAMEVFLRQYGVNTAKTYRAGISAFTDRLDTIDVNDVTVEDVVGWRQYLVGAGAASASISTYWDGARSFFDWCKRAGYITGIDPFSIVRRPTRIRDQQRIAASPTQVRALLGVAINPRDHALITLLAHGLRIQETVNAKPSNIVTVSASEHYLKVLGKGNKERMVPLLRWAYPILLGQVLPGNDAPFVHTNGAPLSVRQAQSVFQSLCRTVGITGITPHSMRHGYATRLLRAGVNLAVVSKLLGHESIKTTEVYLHLGTEDLGVAVEQDPLASVLGTDDDFRRDFTYKFGSRMMRDHTQWTLDGKLYITYRVDD
jgi:site-specific recombinase XerD